MTKQLLFLDFETFYAERFSLKGKYALTIPEYILDERFEVIICAVAVNNGPVEVLTEPELRRFLQGLNPDETTTITHNALFDACILSWRYGFVPAYSLDTLGMARCLLAHCLKSLSLDSVAQALGEGVKGSTVLKVKGMHAADIVAAGLWEEFSKYCANDTDLCRRIFKRMAPAFPPAQFRMMDLVLRCATQPRLLVDRPRLTVHLSNVRKEKEALLQRVGLERGHVLSADRFQLELEKRGIEVETKDGTNGQIPALAKTDPFMVFLQEHEDEEVQALAAARLGLKSTLEEKRAEKLLAISGLPWATPASMPIPLRYSGAHTHRLSGDWGINMQNLPRVTTAGSQLRKCITAPAGCSVVVCDLGQIEARLAAWQAGADELLRQFARPS